MLAAALNVMRPSAMTISDPHASLKTSPPFGSSPKYECRVSYFWNSSLPPPYLSYSSGGHSRSDCFGTLKSLPNCRKRE